MAMFANAEKQALFDKLNQGMSGRTVSNLEADFVTGEVFVVFNLPGGTTARVRVTWQALLEATADI